MDRAVRRPISAASPPVVIRWVDPLLPHIWQIGHQVDGEFRPFAGGSSEEALQSLIAKESTRTPLAGVRDRRHYRRRKALPFGRASSIS